MTTTPPESIEDAPSDRLWNSVEALTSQLCKHVVPIYVDDDRRRPELFGSGLLVAGQGSTFLVSAAPVLDPIRDALHPPGAGATPMTAEAGTTTGSTSAS